MSKRVLVVGGMSDNPEVVQILKDNAAAIVEAGERVKVEIDCSWATFDMLEYTATNEDVLVYDIHNEQPLKIYDLVLFRGKIQTYSRFAQVVCNYLDISGIPYSNRAQGKGPPYGKLAQMFAFREIGVPIPPTYYAASSRMVTHANSVIKFPMIIKDNAGAMGRHNHLVHDPATLKEILTQGGPDFIAQAYIPNDCDYRVFVVGEQHLTIRRRGGKDTHLNNLSTGGAGELVDNDFLPDQVYKHCSAIMDRFALDVAGIDLIYYPDTEEAWFLEVNQLPKIVGGAFYEEKTALLGDWLKAML